MIMETQFNEADKILDDFINLNGEYIRKFISLGVRYNRNETLKLADEYMDRFDLLADKVIEIRQKLNKTK